MQMIDLINKTRSKIPLEPSEINFLVTEFTAGTIPDYQMSAWLMAVCIQGLTDKETTALTLAMAHSGKILDWNDFPQPPIDKHSTGGVGDTTTLILLPLLAACGVTAAKMSGRGLGFTGGTLDKLAAISGFQTILTEEQFKKQLKTESIALTGQSSNLAPADGKIYALRDVTGTVESASLIAASIMSKKLAAGASTIVIDVKVGSGGFMKNLKEAEILAKLMVRIGQLANRKVVAYLTSMEQPLGNYVGNGLEVQEAILLLKGTDLSSDLARVTLALAGEMIALSGLASSIEEGIKKAEEAWLSGKALEKLRLWISLQQGNPTIIDNLALLPQPTFKEEICSTRSGYIQSFAVEDLGILARDLGAGRHQKEDTIDLSAGFILHKRLGDEIKQHEPWITLYSSSPISKELVERANQLLKISDHKAQIPTLILQRIDQNSLS